MLTTLQINPASASVELTGLWNRTFGDDPAAIYAFYRQFSNHMDVMVQMDERERILSAAHFLPVGYHYFHGEWKGSYLYAAMTDESMRGQGLMSQLMRLRMQKGPRRGSSSCARCRPRPSSTTITRALAWCRSLRCTAPP